MTALIFQHSRERLQSIEMVNLICNPYCIDHSWDFENDYTISTIDDISSFVLYI